MRKNKNLLIENDMKLRGEKMLLKIFVAKINSGWSHSQLVNYYHLTENEYGTIMDWLRVVKLSNPKFGAG